jgi:RNA polymerase primary sigma factor
LRTGKREGAMLKDQKVADLQKLISRGRSKGYLTYEEVNDALSDDISSDRMDDMIMVLDEMDIQLIDDESKLKGKPGKESDDDADGDAGDAIDETEVAAEDGRVNDPVKMYLREMGLVSLLTREGEVKIAKRIEKGERQIIAALYWNHPFASAKSWSWAKPWRMAACRSGTSCAILMMKPAWRPRKNATRIF